MPHTTPPAPHRSALPDDASMYSAAAQADLSQRLGRFARTQDPSELWPGVTESARLAAAHELARAVREVLTGRAGVQLDSTGAHDCRVLSVAAHTTGVGPLLARWIHEGRLDAAPDVRDALAWQLAHARRRAARMEREVLPAFDALLAAGVVPTVLKGFYTARAWFEEPGVRRMSDVDVLVDEQEVDRAEAALRSAGFRALGPRLRPYKQDWIGAGVDERSFSVEASDERSKWVLELHARLDRSFHPGAVARLDGERRDTVSFNVAGRPLRALAAPALLVTLACHCSEELGASRLLRLVEIVRLVRLEHESGRLTWNDVLGIFDRTGSACYAYPAFALAEDLAPGTIDARVLHRCARESTWAARHTVRRLSPAGGSIEVLGVMRQVMWMRSPLAVLHRVMRLVAPSSQGRPGPLPGWRVRWRQARAGLLSLRAPDERR